MPIFWRYLFFSYGKIFFSSLFSFILVLLVFQFKEIARFAALTSQLKMSALFIAYQIPSMLPFAIPISALIAAVLLFQRLSQTYELTALRAAGLPFRAIFFPLLCLAALGSLLHFAMSAELAPLCRRASKELLVRTTSSNPLLLLQRQGLGSLKRAYLNLDVEREGKSIRNFLLILYQASQKRLALIQAKELEVEENLLFGKEVRAISHLPEEQGFDTLVIETEQSMSTSAPFLSHMLKKKEPRLEVQELSFPLLHIARSIPSKFGKNALIEMLRRISLALAVFTFSFLGAVFAIDLRRDASKKALLMGISLSLIVFISYFLGKGLKSFPLVATFTLLLPHPLLWMVSLFRLQTLKKGKIG